MKLINLPNIITCCNLLCGCLAIHSGLFGDITAASLYIVLGAVFDFFDGMTARMLHISGPIGKEMDSLADVVTFGVAPSVLCYRILESYSPAWNWIALLAFIMAAFSALRLAKFNCDERQSLSFIGLPTPANALLWIGLAHLNMYDDIHSALSILLYLGAMLVCSCLLICELPMFSLKVKPGHMGFSDNIVRYLFVATAAVILVITAILGLQPLMSSPAAIILLYILFSLCPSKNK